MRRRARRHGVHQGTALAAVPGAHEAGAQRLGAIGHQRRQRVERGVLLLKVQWGIFRRFAFHINGRNEYRHENM